MTGPLALVGPGRVGSAIGRRLQQAGYRFSMVCGRELSRTREACNFIGCPPELATTRIECPTNTRTVLLAVPDDSLCAVARSIQRQLADPAKVTLIHFSGVYPAAHLREPDSRCQVLSVHPLLPFANREQALHGLAECPCGVEGDDSALALGQELVTAIGGRPFAIESHHKALYHAAACLSSNYLVTLAERGRRLLSQCGIAEQDALDLLLSLLRTTLDNIERQGCGQGLTGPIVRGDGGTVARHLAALTENSLPDLALYQQLGELTVDLASGSQRLNSQAAEELRQLLSRYGRSINNQNTPSPPERP